MLELLYDKQVQLLFKETENTTKETPLDEREIMTS